jgi:nucleoside-diphosphate-sugar epimerase
VKKTILLTGSTGYLGSYLAKALISQGHKLILLKRKNSSLSRISSIIQMTAVYNIENLDYSILFNTHGKIDAIIHTATCYGRHVENSSEVFEANTGFPLRLMDAANAAGVDVFINTDTILDKYVNLYSLSKSQMLEWGKFFCTHNKMFFINMRLEHFYGPGDADSKFTTHVMNSCIRNVPELKLTFGEQKRDFIYIDDVVSAYLVILEKLKGFSNLFNEFDVGSGRVLSIREFVEMVHKITESQTHLAFGAIPYRVGEMMNSNSNIEPLLELGWFCKTDLNKGLKLVMEGYKQ